MTTQASSSSSAETIARAAKEAFDASQLVNSAERNKALGAVKRALLDAKAEVLKANALDVDVGKVQVAAGKMESSLLKRLDLQSSSDKYDSMLQGIDDVAALEDPNGKITYAKQLDEGLELYRMTCPIGVLLVIFEARPEVIVNITALAIKSGNAAILKGGKESLNTQAILSTVIQQALSTTSLPSAYIQTVATRDEVSALLEQDRYIDLVIPRGGNALVRSTQEKSRMPVMGHADGLCAVYLDEGALEKKACRVVLDSKTTYTAACNSAETLLVHQSLLSTVFPSVAIELLEADVTLKLDEISLATLTSSPTVSSHPKASTHLVPSSPSDYDTEFLTLTLAVATVSSVSAAITHINTHSSHHTDSIVTESAARAQTFCKGVDSAGVYVNASTRFADGFRYGFGTEVGVSTGKTHARGPVGLEGLVIYKYIAKSMDEQGHVTAEFGVGEGKKPFLHTDLQEGKQPF